jgi:hypothetical protein
MEFISSRPDVVRSITQRWLLSYWNGLRGKDAVPAWPGFRLSELASMGDDLTFGDVIDDNGTPRLFVRFQGKNVAEAFGFSTIGRYLDEVLPVPYRQMSLATCHQVIVTKLPVYTVADMRDRQGRIVHFERLLLPFEHRGTEVGRILASMETVSPEGEFDSHDLMKPKLPTFGLCTTIRH